MPRETVGTIIGSVTVDFPRACVVNNIESCPEICELKQLASTAEGTIALRGLEEAAQRLGEEARANCRGVAFDDSESGVTWTRECSLTHMVENS